MKVTFFIGSLYGGGAERVTCNLATYLSEKGHVVDVLTMAESKQHYNLDERVTNTVLLRDSDRSNKIKDFLHRWMGLTNYIKGSDTDVYIVMLPVTTIMLLLLRKKIKQPIIAAERVDPSTYPSIKKIALRYLAPRANKFIFQTSEIRNWYGKKVRDDKAVVIPNAINSVFIRQPYQGKKEKTIVGIGRLTNQKNFSLLIDAFYRISRKHNDYKLVIYGEGPNRSMLLEKAANLGISDRIELPGNVSNIPELLEKASIFVLSSDFEGMPNALMEAMALGVPCVSTDCNGGGARFLIDNGENGLLVPKNNPDAMAESILKYIEDTEFAHRISQNARKITSKLSPETIYGKWESVILGANKERKQAEMASRAE